MIDISKINFSHATQVLGNKTIFQDSLIMMLIISLFSDRSSSSCQFDCEMKWLKKAKLHYQLSVGVNT